MWPYGTLTNHGYVADFVMASNPSLEVMLESDRYNTIISPRFVFQEPELFAQSMHSRGKRWIFEMDDDLISELSVYRQMTHNPENLDIESEIEVNRQLGLRTIKVVDAITVSSEPLADIVRQNTDKPVKVVPNFINIDVFRNRLRDKTRSIRPLTIGWSGGMRDNADLEMLIQAWPVIAKMYPDVQFIVFGYECKPLIECLPPDRLTFIQGVSFDDYPGMLLNIDISCCIVDDNAWNDCKTAVKWMEASLSGSACVVSEAVYGRYVQNQVNAMVASNINEWVNSLARLIESPSMRSELVRQSQKAIVNDYSLSKNWQEWLSAWI